MRISCVTVPQRYYVAALLSRQVRWTAIMERYPQKVLWRVSQLLNPRMSR